MTEIDFAALQRQLAERAATIWDPDEAALLAGPPRPRPAAAKPGLESLQREAEARAAAIWDPDEVPLMEDNPAPVPLAEAWIDAVENAEDAVIGANKMPFLGTAYFTDYLKGDHWTGLRKRMLLRAGRLCQRCHGTSLRLEVHHLTYRNLGQEREHELIVLCHACHELEHGRTW